MERALRQSERDIITTLYKFRFGTNELLARKLSKSRRSLLNTLHALTEQGYLKRRYNKHYRLQGKPASYCLGLEGIRSLRKINGVDTSVLKWIYSDRSIVTRRFIDHSIAIFAAYDRIQGLSPAASKFYTKSFLKGTVGFPYPLPDAYLVFEQATPTTDHTHRYLIECFDTTMSHAAMKRRLKYLSMHAGLREWQASTDYPLVVLICSSQRMQIKVQHWAEEAMRECINPHLSMHATTLEDLVKLPFPVTPDVARVPF